ncbi:MAG: Uma2 family endonuclease [Dehalococcoidia bacterium]|nr:Uma2 family endonuclease [Dehalococcoidia bacterium]
MLSPWSRSPPSRWTSSSPFRRLSRHRVHRWRGRRKRCRLAGYHAARLSAPDPVASAIALEHPAKRRAGNRAAPCDSTPAERAYLADISRASPGERFPRSREARYHGPCLDRAPDFAIEVLSPGESPGRILERADFLMSAGTELLWLVDPELETVTVYRPGQQPAVHRAPDNLAAQPVPVQTSHAVARRPLRGSSGEDATDDGE